jgi:hypothetical protein
VGRRGHCKIRGYIFFVHRTVSEVKRVKFVSDRMPYTVQRGRWFNIIVLNIHATNEKKSNVTKDSSCEEVQVQVQVYVSKYHVKVLLGDFNAKLGTEDIFNPTS